MFFDFIGSLDSYYTEARTWLKTCICMKAAGISAGKCWHLLIAALLRGECDAFDLLKPVLKHPIRFDLHYSTGQCGATDDPECDGNNVTAFNVVPGTRENGTNRCRFNLVKQV